MTVFNRKDVTLECLKNLFKCITKDTDRDYSVFLTNDGCSDGTPQAVRLLFPTVNVIDWEEGGLYWSRGMNMAWEAAVKSGGIWDYFLWLNDDAMLNTSAFDIMFDPLKSLNEAIVSGIFMDDQRRLTYGGANSNGHLQPNGSYQEIKYMNGNCVLVPASVMRKIGRINKHYHHQFGDYDYGLMAQKRGIKVVVTKDYVGICNGHKESELPYFDIKKTLVQRLKCLRSPKWLPEDTFYYLIRWEGVCKAFRYYIPTYVFTVFPRLKVRTKKDV